MVLLTNNTLDFVGSIDIFSELRNKPNFHSGESNLEFWEWSTQTIEEEEQEEEEGEEEQDEELAEFELDSNAKEREVYAFWEGDRA